jgi:hypothetical protein
MYERVRMRRGEWDKPCRVNATGLSVEEPGLGAVGVEADDKSADAKGTDTTRLGIALLNLSDVFCNVLDGNGVFDGQAVTLCFQTGLVDEDSGVGVQTGKGKADVVVDETNLGGGDAGVLELHGTALFTTQDDNLVALDTDGASSCEATRSVGEHGVVWRRDGIPRLTASRAYSTWKTCPSGLKTVGR